MHDKSLKNEQFKGREMKIEKNRGYVSGLIVAKDSKGRGNNNYTTIGKGNIWSKSETTQQRLVNSKSGLLHSSKEKSENVHEVMLQNELNKFRGEIERRYKNSKTNNEYTFPRNENTNSKEYTEDCSCNSNLTFNSKNYTCKYKNYKSQEGFNKK
jgi:hypothetical protein